MSTQAWQYVGTRRDIKCILDWKSLMMHTWIQLKGIIELFMDLSIVLTHYADLLTELVLAFCQLDHFTSAGLNTSRPRQNGRHFSDIFKCIFLYEIVWILIKISLKFFPKGPINNISALDQIMAWHHCLCPIHWSQVLSQEWRCSWSSTDRQCSKYIWVINNFIAYWGVTYIGGLRVVICVAHYLFICDVRAWRHNKIM